MSKSRRVRCMAVGGGWVASWSGTCRCSIERSRGHNARVVVEGLLSRLERKTAKPIAREHGVPRKPIQFFVGSS